jgi:hypothetical protein
MRAAMFAVLVIAAMPRICMADQGPEAPGFVSAVTYHALSAGEQIAVVVLDDSPIDRAVAARIKDELMRQGRAAANDHAGATLTFRTDVDTEPQHARRLGAGRRWSGSPDLPDLEDHHWEHLRGSVDAEAQVPLFPLGRISHSGAADADAPTYVLKATLDDAATGQRLWESEISYRGAIASDDTAAFNSLVPRLVQGIGKTVRGDRFRLDCGDAAPVVPRESRTRRCTDS